MREIRPDSKKIATVSAVLFLAIFALVLWYFNTPPSVLIESIAKTGLVLTLVGLFWVYYEKWGWRWQPARLFGWLCNTPNLQGRWEGTVCRDGPGEKEHPIILEISQTFSSLKFRTFGERSSGESLSVLLISKDDQELMWEAHAVWQTKARKIGGGESLEDFYGASTWKISVDQETGTAEINDIYFTSRKTAGRIKVRRVSNKLKGAFS
jgi:SMODS-associating 2TM, beta-strand rich effector domain